jgi:trimeric autotransporter adhesin
MKQILSLALALLPCLAWAQYPSNGNQKITLGEQTTADGLIWRGVAADTTKTVKTDTSAWIVLDTANSIMYHYDSSSVGRKWLRVGGSISSDMTGTLPVANGGTGGTTYSDSTILQGRGTSAIASSTDLLFNYSTKTLKVNGLYLGLGNSNVSTNIKIGNLAALSKTSGSGSGNTAIGRNALENNTTGKDHIAIGAFALWQNTTGGYSTAIGSDALQQMTTANFNCAIGRSSLQGLKTGGRNVGIGGTDAGGYADSTSNSTIIGTEAGAITTFLTGGSNNTLIGYRAISSTGTVSNEITLGNSSITTIRAAVQTISSLSDRRDKTDIIPLNYGMNFIEKLKPVKFVWDMRDGGKIGVNDIGFIAQDLLQSQVDLGINIPNLVSGTDEKLEASYSVLLPIIVKALQDANYKIKQLELRIINLENK